VFVIFPLCVSGVRVKMTYRLSAWPILGSKFVFSTHTPGFLNYTCACGKLDADGEMYAMHRWFKKAIKGDATLTVFNQTAIQPFNVKVERAFLPDITTPYIAPCVCLHFKLTYLSHAWNTVQFVTNQIQLNMNNIQRHIVKAYNVKLNHALRNVKRANDIMCDNGIETLPAFANSMTLLTHIIECTKCYLWYNSELLKGDNIIDLKQPMVPFATHNMKLSQFRMCLLALMATSCIACTHLKFADKHYKIWVDNMKEAAIARLHILHAVERCVYEVTVLPPGTASPSAAVMYNMRNILLQVDVSCKIPEYARGYQILAIAYMQALVTIGDTYENSYTMETMLKDHIDHYETNLKQIPFSFINEETQPTKGYKVAEDGKELQIFNRRCIQFPKKYLERSK
jgi:hypothetical protein